MAEDLTHTKTHYARKYARSVSTINNWIAKNAPLDDEKAMVAFIAEREKYGQPGIKPSRPDVIAEPAKSASHMTTGSQTGKSEAQLKRDKMEVDLDISKHKLAVAMGEYIDRKAVREAGIRIGNTLDAQLRAVEQEIPGTCAGMSEVQLKAKIREFFIKLRKNVQQDLEAAAPEAS